MCIHTLNILTISAGEGSNPPAVAPRPEHTTEFRERGTKMKCLLKRNYIILTFENTLNLDTRAFIWH